MATPGEKLTSDLSAAAAAGKDVKDILNEMNVAMRDYGKTSLGIKQTSKDIAMSYGLMLKKVKNLGEANDRNLIAQQSIKAIDAQIAIVNSEISDLKKRGLIIDAKSVELKNKELAIEHALNEAIIIGLIDRQTSGLAVSAGEMAAINKQIDRLKVKNVMLAAETKFNTDRLAAGDAIHKGLVNQIKTLAAVKGKYEDIVDLTLEQTKSDEKRNVLLKSFLGILGTMSPILGKVGTDFVTIGQSIYKAYKAGGLLAAFMAAVTEYLKIGVERFKELQETAEKFRKDTGLTLSQTSDISQYVKELNVQYQSMGVSLQEAYDSAKELMSELGNSKVLDNNKSLIQTSSLLAANYGVAAADAAGFQLSMMRAGENSAASAENMSVVAIKMSEAAGVSLPQVMKNVSAASGTTLAMVRGSNVELVKAAVHAKRFGLELETVAGAARKSLNFYESITDEMEASVLVGQQLSFQSARERAFAGDMVGFQNEILKTIGSIDKFGERSIFEQEAVAKAAGIELKELKKMLQVEEQLKKLSSTDRAEYDRLLKDNAKITEEDGKQLLKKQQIQNQLTRINNSFTAIKNKIGDSLQPALEVVADLIEGIAKWTNKTLDFFGFWPTAIISTITALGLVAGAIFLITKGVLGLGGAFASVSAKIGTGITSITTFITTGITSITTTIATGITSIGTALTSLSGKAATGAFTLALLAAAAIGLALAFKLAAEGIKLLLDAGVGFGELMAAIGIGMLIAAASLYIITAGLTALGAAAPAALPGVGILTVALLGLSLLAVAIGYSAKLMGEGFKLAGDGAKLFADSLGKLAEIGFLKLSAGLYGISGAILTLSASLITMSASGTPNFLNELASMSTKLLTVASALEKIANALERISNIKSLPKLEMPQYQQPSSGNTEAFAFRAGGETSEVSSEKEKSNNNIIDKVDKLTESVDQLVQFMKSGGAIASVYINKRAMMKELAMQS